MTPLEQIIFGVGLFSLGASGLLVMWALWAFLCDAAHMRLLVAEQCDRLSDHCQDCERRERIAEQAPAAVDWDRELADLLEGGA